MIEQGRYRRRTPDLQYQTKMREVLKQRLDDMPINISRDEVEALGVEIGLEDPTEAARLFNRLKGVSWSGEYITSEEKVWVAARITDVS